MPRDQDDEGQRDEPFPAGTPEEQEHEEKRPDPTDRRADDDHAVGMENGPEPRFPIIGNGKTERSHDGGQLTPRGGEDGIKQQGTAEGERGGGVLPGLLLGKTAVVPEFGGTRFQERRVGQQRTVAGEGIKRMAGAERFGRRRGLLGSSGAER